ncbi:MAG: hypothetical protein MZV64_19505 [Ignavibacteriales bacterium]|nr:hypothetical protein [Ignavibacteriales bacterium]
MIRTKPTLNSPSSVPSNSIPNRSSSSPPSGDASTRPSPTSPSSATCGFRRSTFDWTMGWRKSSFAETRSKSTEEAETSSR